MTIINFEDKFTDGFDEDALTTSTSDERLINFGNLRTTGDLANGIFADADDVTVRNFADIETLGLGAAGICVQGTMRASKTSGRCTRRAIFLVILSSFPKASSPSGMGSILPITARSKSRASPHPPW